MGGSPPLGTAPPPLPLGSSEQSMVSHRPAAMLPARRWSGPASRWGGLSPPAKLMHFALLPVLLSWRRARPSEDPASVREQPPRPHRHHLLVFTGSSFLVSSPQPPAPASTSRSSLASSSGQADLAGPEGPGHYLQPLQPGVSSSRKLSGLSSAGPPGPPTPVSHSKWSHEHKGLTGRQTYKTHGARGYGPP